MDISIWLGDHFYKVDNFNPLYNGGLFHCYMLDESICHFRGDGSILWLLFYLHGLSILILSIVFVILAVESLPN